MISPHELVCTAAAKTPKTLHGSQSSLTELHQQCSFKISSPTLGKNERGCRLPQSEIPRKDGTISNITISLTLRLHQTATWVKSAVSTLNSMVVRISSHDSKRLRVATRIANITRVVHAIFFPFWLRHTYRK